MHNRFLLHCWCAATLLITPCLAFPQSGRVESHAAQTLEHIEPPNWWVGMQEPGLQLMLHGADIAKLDVTVHHPGLRLEQIIRTGNPNYVFLHLQIDTGTPAGSFPIVFSRNGQELFRTDYTLQSREPGSARRQGFGNQDVVYLITPDRFANGDPGNDVVPGLLENRIDRKAWQDRHGGDLEGVRQHLDYIRDMGYTAIWMTPVLENNGPRYSYHGYAMTDLYKVDPRFGSNASFRQLCAEARAKGVSMIMDQVANHIGINHWWMEDLPAPDWINVWPEFTRTNHAKTAWQDPYAAASDRQLLEAGWFDTHMPDLNQSHPLLAQYLIQNAIWWTEYLGLSGIRMDTWPYPDAEFMAEWSRRLMLEYPNFNIVGEMWHETPAFVAAWQKGRPTPAGNRNYLPCLMDFPLQTALIKALTQEENWNSGWIHLYETQAQDFLYTDPFNLMVLPDNHDMSRIFTRLGEDYDLFRLALAHTMTVRGIPQLFYGTEILMSNPGTDDHGVIRSDFPGGWPGDEVNGFTGKNLAPQQREARDFVKKLLNWRKTATAIHNGRMVHYYPQDGVYVFFRYDETQKVMVILNKNQTPYTLDTARFAEMLRDATTGVDVLSGTSYSLSDGLPLPVRSPLILEVK